MPTTNTGYLDLIMGRLGARTNPRVRSALIDETNVAKLQLENGKFLPWFLETTGAWVLSPSVNYYDLPSNFIREIEDREAFIWDPDSGEETRIHKLRDEDRYRLSTSADATGLPARYSITGTRFYFVPAPDKAYEFRIPYMGYTPDFADDATLHTWLAYAPNVLLGLAASVVAGFHLQNERLEARMAGLHQNAWRELYAQHEARLHTNMDYSDSDLLI